MRNEWGSEVRQQLVLLLAAAQREPALIRRRRRAPTPREREEFERLCDRLGGQAVARGLTEETLKELPVR